MHGWQQSSPYDVIVFTGSVPFLEESIQQQLKPGGRLFVITGQSPVMEARLIRRISENDWQDEVLFETDLAALEGATQIEAFTFYEVNNGNYECSRTQQRTGERITGGTPRCPG